MKLRNKKTGKIVDATMSYREDTAPIVVSETTCDENGQRQGWPYNSLAELNEEWEDYKEPKKYWTVECGVAVEYTSGDERFDRPIEAVGLKFDTKEECELAIEKLKAWTRVKDKGFRFKMWEYDDKYATEFPCILIRANKIKNCEYDLDLLFSGENGNKRLEEDDDDDDDDYIPTNYEINDLTDIGYGG